MAKKTVTPKTKDKSMQGSVESLAKAREELFKMKVDLSLRKLKNTRSIFLKRKEIARTLTAMSMAKSTAAKAMADKGGKENE